MFRRGVLLFLSILVTLGYVVSGRAAPPQQVTVFPITVTVLKSANVRDGPGTDFAVVSSARPGQRLRVLGCNMDCSWYLLAEDCWIAAFLVKPDQPVVPPVVPPLITGAVLIPTIVVSSTVVIPGATIQTTQCPQTIAQVNTYAGPGTFYAVVDTRPAGECVAVIGRNFIGDWYQLYKGMWIQAAAILYAEPLETMEITDRIFTATPVPTPTPLPPPILSVEEQDYINFLVPLAESYEVAWTTLENLFTLAAQNPLLIATEEWRTEVAEALMLIQVTNKSIRSRVPPPRFAPVFTELVVATNHYELAVSLVAEAIDTLDASKLVAAQTSIAEGNAAIQRALGIVEGLKLAPITAQVTPAISPTFAPVSGSKPSVPTPTPQIIAPPSTSGQGCDPNYSGTCVQLTTDDLNCPQIPAKNFNSIGTDPHELDGDKDGVACEEE